MLSKGRFFLQKYAYKYVILIEISLTRNWDTTIYLITKLPLNNFVILFSDFNTDFEYFFFDFTLKFWLLEETLL